MRSNFDIKRIVFIKLIFAFWCIYSVAIAQTWIELENAYNDHKNKNENDLALKKAKEMYQWVTINENDTSIHLPIALKYIGNSFQFFSLNYHCKMRFTIFRMTNMSSM